MTRQVGIMTFVRQSDRRTFPLPPPTPAEPLQGAVQEAIEWLSTRGNEHPVTLISLATAVAPLSDRPGYQAIVTVAFVDGASS